MDLTGKSCLATCGPYEGQFLTVIGPCWLLPGEDLWDVETEGGAVWFVPGDVLRRLFALG